MGNIKWLAVMLAVVLILSVLFYGVTLPAKDYLGCYINNEGTKKICILEDNSFEQLKLQKGKWVVYGRSIWSSLTMSDAAGNSEILTVESIQRNNGDTLSNVTLQPYKNILGQIKISSTIDVKDFEEGEIFRKK